MTSGRFTALLLGLVLALGLLSGLDVVTSDVGDSTDLVRSDAARSGAWTCPLPGLANGAEGNLVAAAPPGDSGIASDVTYDEVYEGDVTRVARASAFPEQAVGTTVVGRPNDVATAELGLAVRWRRQPAAIGRAWRIAGDQGPGGVLSAPCIAGTSSLWAIPGVSTAGGAEASLVLSNPFSSDASVVVTLALPDGPQQPVLLENVVVPAHSVRRVPLNEHAPEQRDLGIVVTTRSGRVVVEAMQTVNAAIGGIEGVSLVPAATAGGASWTIPWVAAAPRPADPAATVDAVDEPSDDPTPAADPDAPTAEVLRVDGLTGTPSSWVWITNVGDDDAVLLLTVHGPDGSELVDAFDQPVLAPGAVRRVELDGLLPPGTPRSGVTVATENGVPIVASVATQVAQADEDRTGFTVQLGAPATDPVWVVPGEAPLDREWLLSLVNTGGQEATVDVSLWTEAGVLRPAEVQGLVLPAGSQRLVDLTDVVDPSLTAQVVHVRARAGQVVAGRVGWSPGGDLELVAHLGVPSAVWSGGTLVPTTRFDPGLTGDVVREDEAAAGAG